MAKPVWIVLKTAALARTCVEMAFAEILKPVIPALTTADHALSAVMESANLVRHATHVLQIAAEDKGDKAAAQLL